MKIPHAPSSWWDDKCEVLSSSLWLPTTQTLKNMKQSYAGFVHSEVLRNAWFESEIYSLSDTPSTPDTSSKGLAHEAQRSRRIRIYPDAEQRSVLVHWLEAVQYVYNKTLEYIAQGNSPSWAMAKSYVLRDLPDWTGDVPAKIQASAVRDACTNYNKALRSGGKVHRKTAADAKQSLVVPGASVNSKGIYRKYLGSMIYSEDLPAPEGNCRITRENNRWFVSIPVKVCIQGKSGRRAVSLDPGIRTFMTFYSPESCGKIGKGAFSRIYSLCRYFDSLNVRMQDMKHRERYKAKKAAEKLRWKIENLIEDLQHKTALFLVKNFDVIALPEYRTDFTDGIASRSAREMVSSAHSGFQEFLRCKADEWGKSIVVQDEQGTSATCSWNGQLRTAGRVIRNEGVTLDRDYNGARGIFLRALRESAIPEAVRPHSGDAVPVLSGRRVQDAVKI